MGEGGIDSISQNSSADSNVGRAPAVIVGPGRTHLMKKSIVFVLGLLFYSSAALVGQNASSIIEKLEKITTEKEPDWKLDRKLPSDQIIVLRWSSGEDRIFLSIFLTDSSERAKEAYADSIRRMNGESGADTTRSSVPDLGEENQLWGGNNPGRSARLVFRQGKVQVLLFAPTAEVAKRFGRYVLEVLPRAKASQVQTSKPEWKEYSSAAGRFSVLFPGNPSEETQVAEVAPGVEMKFNIHKHKAVAECSVMYSDYPMPVDDPAVANRILDAGAKGAAASINAELLELKEINLDGHPGRYLKERLVSKEIMRAKMYLVGQRLYQVAITTPPEQGMAAEMIKTYAAMADKFLNSFKVVKKDEKKLIGRALVSR